MTTDKEGGADQELTFFGSWVHVLCDLLGTKEALLSDRAGVTRPSVHHLTHMQRDKSGDLYEPRPKLETVSKLWNAVQSFAQDRYARPFENEFRESFYNAADHVSPEQRELAEMRLQMLRSGATLATQLAEKERELEQLRRENDALRRRIRRRE